MSPCHRATATADTTRHVDLQAAARYGTPPPARPLALLNPQNTKLRKLPSSSCLVYSMSSLQRTRSLRKPTNSSSSPADSASSAPRSVSPSRLPLKPASRPRPRPLPIHGSATTASTTANTTTTTNTTRTTRSASTQLARTTSLSQKRTPPLPAQDPTKKDSRYAPLRSATRSASGGSTTTRPTSAGGPGTRPTRAPIPTHTRAKSTVTSLSAATALRPLSRDVSASLKRGHGRSVSVDKASCATPIRQQQQPQQQQTHREKQPCSPTTAVASKPHLRPAFSTLQQHYSPAKTQAPKPLTSAILAPPSPSKLPANIAASAAASKLQAELLQLHVLHRDAGAVYAEWQASAEDTLRDRFHGLKVGSGEVAERERSALEGENLLALRQWARGGAAGRDLEGRIQVLDEVVTSLWVLSEPAGRYARLVRRFERFVDRACDAEDARGSSLGEGEGEALDGLFVEELDAGWKGEVAMLTRRLEMWKGQFQSIDDFVGSGTGIAAREGGSASALERMLEGVRGLLQGMLDELYAMEEMEALVLAREEAWIERMNMREEEQQDGEVEAGAIWRVV